MNYFEKANPSNQNPHQINDLEPSETQESFRQNFSFAEKILPPSGIFPPTSDEHDIRKVTREKVENMLYAEKLQSESHIPESHARLGPQGINLWVWENRVQSEIQPLLLQDYLKQNMTNTPLVFFRKYEHVRQLLVIIARFYQITIDQVQNEHLLNTECLQYASEHASKSTHCAHLIRFLVRKSIHAGFLSQGISPASDKTPHQRLKMHPRVLNYQSHLEARGLSRDYIRHTVASVQQLFGWLCANIGLFMGTSPDQISILQIQNDHILAFRTYKLKQVTDGTCSPVTFCHHISSIRLFFYYLKERFGYEPPLKRFRAIKAPRYNPRDTPTNQQIGIYFQVVDRYSADPIREQIGYRLLFHLGLRLSEAANIKWNDINLGTRTIVIRSKGKKSHLLPLAGTLLDLLRQNQNMWSSQCYLLGHHPQSIANHLYRHFKLYAMIAGWPFPGGVHFFRHIFITRLAKKGILPQAMKELARVSRLDTVSLYIHLGRQDKYMINQINMLKYE
ncbi:site-specific integrase [Paenibacillus sp. 7124]|uniref:Site-specific integrase n=1 Tax=Paenibacillus apii TaxID=1850370 RepID=A0A6M1PP32_9BACL|nr:site-specific integrase [Paenibacillus apii]NGM83952.1 site-specific integrase [Paenibacillus apii]